jgi:hypothetical protein
MMSVLLGDESGPDTGTDTNLTTGRLDQASQQTEYGALPTAVGADQRHGHSSGNTQIGRRKSSDLSVVDPSADQTRYLIR